jgi:hypothetical protein
VVWDDEFLRISLLLWFSWRWHDEVERYEKSIKKTPECHLNDWISILLHITCLLVDWCWEEIGKKMKINKPWVLVFTGKLWGVNSDETINSQFFRNPRFSQNDFCPFKMYSSWAKVSFFHSNDNMQIKSSKNVITCP